MRSLVGGVAIAALWSVTVAQVAGQVQPGSGIASTKHDFSILTNTNAVGACTYCHTPHKAIQTRLLWNHTLSTNSFSWDVGTTTGGTPMPTIAGGATGWAGPSKFCLSCHDGTVAIGDVNWFMAQARTGANNNNGTTVGEAYRIATATGSMAGNHPVAHPFPFQGVASTYNAVTTGTPALASGWVSDPTVNGIRLFVQTGTNVAAGTQSGATGIECSSCHDPHNGTGVTGSYFLRGSLTGNQGGSNGYICLKCHQK